METILNTHAEQTHKHTHTDKYINTATNKHTDESNSDVNKRIEQMKSECRRESMTEERKKNNNNK